MLYYLENLLQQWQRGTALVERGLEGDRRRMGLCFVKLVKRKMEAELQIFLPKNSNINNACNNELVH